MSTINWISLAIILVSLIVFIYSLSRVKKTVRQTTDGINDLKQSIDLEVKHSMSEFEFQMQKVEQIKEKADVLKGRLQSETMSIEHFQMQQAALKDAILNLEKNLPEIMDYQSQTFVEKMKEKSTKTWDALKLTFKKQKARLSK